MHCRVGAVNHYELVFLALDIRDVHVVGGGAEIFELLASEDVYGNEMDLGVAMLAGFGRTHFDDLAGAALDDDESVLAKRRALHRVGFGSTRIGALEGMLMLLRNTMSRVRRRVALAHAPVLAGKDRGKLGETYLGIVGHD